MNLRDVKESVKAFLRGDMDGRGQTHNKVTAQIPDSEDPAEGYSNRSSHRRVQ